MRGARPGTAGLATVFVPDMGRYCVSLWSRDIYDRLSDPASVWVDVPPDGDDDEVPEVEVDETRW